jgi:hypothetical protein
MIRRLNPAELEKLLRKYRRQLDKTNGTGAEALAKVGTRIERRIVREMLSGSGPVTDDQLQSFQRAIRQSVAQGNPEFTALMEEHIPEVWSVALNRTVDSVALMTSGARTIDQVVAVADKFERDIANKSLIQAGKYTDLWRAQWTDEWTRTARVIQSKFTNATITGQSWETVARGLTDELGNLQIAGRMDPAAFAEAFVRTKFTELDNAAGIAMAQEMGLDEFINAGIPDDRQSDECYDASQEEPHSLEWWETESPDGPPPRHVFNCRCMLLAVTPETTWEGMPNPAVEERRAGKQEEVAV